ncbi:ABC transporter permease subunit [Streptomyces sp. S07_1.15]|uniref:ABC transporter permease n=1 Tax=Streptomyces sp. S07_1.15 TaxID=2873925 RepID=UPI001D142CF3|nr:ABC transporter permease subunit [Streptomyces sp. S07_1.15]MCC3651623.1 ABC transporter permease subunit [Streptomyces sp. S07_1.15]
MTTPSQPQPGSPATPPQDQPSAPPASSTPEQRPPAAQPAPGPRDTVRLAPERRAGDQPSQDRGEDPRGHRPATETPAPAQPRAQQSPGQAPAVPPSAAPGPYGQAPAPVPPQQMQHPDQHQPHAQPHQPYGAHPQQGHQQPGGHGPLPAQGGYASPIPVRDAHLGHAIAAEWTKIRSVRSTVWTLAVLAFLVLGIGFLINVFTDDGDYGTQAPIANGLFGLILGQICVVTLGVLVITSEYGTGLIRTTLTAAPRRSRVLTAKVLVFLAVSWTVTTAVCTLTALMGAGMHSGPGVASADGGQWAGATVLAGLYVSLLGLLALAVGTLLRHSAGAITAMLGVVLLPAILPAFLLFSESMRPAAEKILEYNAINSLAALHRVNDGGDGLSQLLLLAVVTAVALAGAYAALEKRDV